MIALVFAVGFLMIAFAAVFVGSIIGPDRSETRVQQICIGIIVLSAAAAFISLACSLVQALLMLIRLPS